MNWLAETQRCPGLFYGTPAQDGYLLRIRIPGGQLDQQQGLALVQLCQELCPAQGDGGSLQITNRANLQLRGFQQAPSQETWQTLQALGLAAQTPALDHLRNLMASPTAGIDTQEHLDSRPFIQALDAHLQTQTEWVGLPAKFSVGLDGGGLVGVGYRSPVIWEHRPNEIQFTAVTHANKLGLQLTLAGHLTELLIPPADALAFVTALIHAYLDALQSWSDELVKPRLRQILQAQGLTAYLDRVRHHWGRPLPTQHLPPLPASQPYAHLGVHPQRQPERVYLGMSISLGRLRVNQLLGLLDLAQQFGSGGLRLTPWQTVILPDIPNSQTAAVLSRLTRLGLVVPQANAFGFPAQIVACAGRPGCASAHTDTQTDACALAAQLPPTPRPINIHLTGCSKACAQPSPADITLLGVASGHYYLYQQAAELDSLSVRQLAQQSPMAVLTAAELPETLLPVLDQQPLTSNPGVDHA